MHKIEEIRDMKDRLMKIGGMALDCADKVDTEELGEVVDMIKDLAEAEEKCMKAKYYEAVIKGMQAYEIEDIFGDEDEDPMTMMNHRRGYTPSRSSRTGRFISNAQANNRNQHYNANMNRGYPYHPDESMMMEDPRMEDGAMPTERFGRPYNEYRRFRRNYTETKSRDDKTAMEKRAQEHVQDTISTIKDIWNTSDPELRKRMKADFTNLLSEMN